MHLLVGTIHLISLHLRSLLYRYQELLVSSLLSRNSQDAFRIMVQIMVCLLKKSLLKNFAYFNAQIFCLPRVTSPTVLYITDLVVAFIFWYYAPSLFQTLFRQSLSFLFHGGTKFIQFVRGFILLSGLRDKIIRVYKLQIVDRLSKQLVVIFKLLYFTVEISDIEFGLIILISEYFFFLLEFFELRGELPPLYFLFLSSGLHGRSFSGYEKIQVLLASFGFIEGDFLFQASDLLKQEVHQFGLMNMEVAYVKSLVCDDTLIYLFLILGSILDRFITRLHSSNYNGSFLKQRNIKTIQLPARVAGNIQSLSIHIAPNSQDKQIKDFCNFQITIKMINRLFNLGVKTICQTRSTCSPKIKISAVRYCFTSTSDPTQVALLEQVQGKVFQVLRSAAKCDQKKLTKQATFEQLGFDSLDSVELVVAMEQYFGFDIPNEQAEKITTVQASINTFYRHLNSKVANKLVQNDQNSEVKTK